MCYRLKHTFSFKVRIDHSEVISERGQALESQGGCTSMAGRLHRSSCGAAAAFSAHRRQIPVTYLPFM